MPVSRFSLRAGERRTAQVRGGRFGANAPVGVRRGARDPTTLAAYVTSRASRGLSKTKLRRLAFVCTMMTSFRPLSLMFLGPMNPVVEYSLFTGWEQLDTVLGSKPELVG